MPHGGCFAGLLPALSTEEKEALASSIREHGVRDPVLVDENGDVIDGRHRLEIDPNAPRKVLSGLTAAEKKAMVFQTNFARRNLSLDQRRELSRTMKQVARELKQEGKTQETIAALMGIPRSTVANWFQEKNGNNVHSDNVSIDARIKISPKSKPLILNRVVNGDTPEQVAADLKVTPRRIRQIVTSEGKRIAERESRVKAAAEFVGESGIHVGDFRVAGEIIEDETVDLIFTDPPYLEDCAPLYGDLAKFAERVLRPGGWCLAYSGHYIFPDVLNEMKKHLEYGWVFGILHSGGDARFRKFCLQVKWKPIAGFYKPPLTAWWDWFPDVCSGGREKSDHEWQQATGEAEHFISALSPSNGLICDPFCGSGTTCVAAANLGRRWIAFEIDEHTALKARERTINEMRDE
jgi:hypothetical protein